MEYVDRLTEMQEKHEEEQQRQVELESWQEQEREATNECYLQTVGGQNTAVPKWSDVFGSISSGKERPQESMRMAPPSYMGPTLLPRSMHDARVEGSLSQRQNGKIFQLIPSGPN